jgi:hypothetical protein
VSKLSGQIAALGAVFAVGLTLTACGGGIPSNAVVSVNGNGITNSTFSHWMMVAANSSSASAADLQSLHRPSRSDGAEARQGPGKADRHGAQGAV